MKIVADSHIPFVEEYFAAYGELVLKSGRAISHEDVKDADILLVRSITHVNEKLLANTKVKFVGSVTAGADHLDTAWLESQGILWSVADGFNAPPVADYVVSVIAALQTRQLLVEKKLKAVVIGVGNVGRLVVDKLRALGFDVLQCDPLRAEKEQGFSSISINDIEEVDLITLHVPLTRTGPHATHHVIGGDFLRKQKPGCVLINASRGAVIHSNDLMQHGKHLYWCLDVWEHEPTIEKAILERAMIGTPHIAGYSVQSRVRGIQIVYQQACKKGVIEPQALTPIDIPYQHLSFAGGDYGWRDIVLGVFNPFLLTAMLRAAILPVNEYGVLFDEMRNQFNYRYELAFTEAVGAHLSDADESLLNAFGLKTTIQEPDPGL
jgi:erythronate-4-phosphate dehydrogenase